MRYKAAKESGPLPEYHSTYVHSVEMKDAISVHAVPGWKPDKLLAERAPNQTDAEYKYALANYQQCTMPVYLDTVHTMQRAFSDNNWSIDWPDMDGDDTIREYLEDGLRATPLAMTFEQFMFQVVPSLKLVDAMGCIAYKPYYIPTVQTEAGEILIDGQTAFRPMPYYYPSEQVVAYDEGRWYAFLADERSWVDWGGKPVQEGLIYEVYDETGIYRVIQVGKKTDYEFVTELYHQHELGYCPVDRLKGIPAWMDGSILWQSLFLYAVPVLNDVVLDSVMLRSIKAASVFPYRVMTGDMCTNTMDYNGQILNCNGTGYFQLYDTGKQMTCPNCMGTGLKNRISPHGVLLLRPDSALKEGEMKSAQPAMYYVEPTTNTPVFLRTEIDNGLTKARNILHLRTTESKTSGPVDGDITATQAALDDKALYSTVKMFRDQVADSLQFGIKCMGEMRYGTAFEEPVITWSDTFDFNTEEDYIMRISNSIKAGMPPMNVYAMIYKYIKTLFDSDPEQTAAFSLLLDTDSLLVLPYDQINIEAAKGTVAGWQVILHGSGITLIKELLAANADFFNQEPTAQREQLIALAKKRADEVKPASGGVQDIINRIAPQTPPPTE